MAVVMDDCGMSGHLHVGRSHIAHPPPPLSPPRTPPHLLIWKVSESTVNGFAGGLSDLTRSCFFGHIHLHVVIWRQNRQDEACGHLAGPDGSGGVWP